MSVEFTIIVGTDKTACFASRKVRRNSLIMSRYASAARFTGTAVALAARR
jgi:hypothetical protein